MSQPLDNRLSVSFLTERGSEGDFRQGTANKSYKREGSEDTFAQSPGVTMFEMRDPTADALGQFFEADFAATETSLQPPQPPSRSAQIISSSCNSSRLVSRS